MLPKAGQLTPAYHKLLTFLRMPILFYRPVAFLTQAGAGVVAIAAFQGLKAAAE